MDERGKRPLLLTVLDGWGMGRDWEFNAVSRSGLEFFPEWLAERPWRTLLASGAAVGLPDGQMGNSEVGHLTLGAGRVVLQELPRISKAIEDGSFYRNPVLLEACAVCREKPLHLMGLLSDGGVHSHIRHLEALVRLAKQSGVARVAIHCFLDGRDTSPRSGVIYLKELGDIIRRERTGTIATIMGRYYAMDRDKRWERTEEAYRALTEGAGTAARNPVEAIEKNYDAGVTDEFVRPLVFPCAFGRVEDGDGIIFFNFRADRARELSLAFNDDSFTGFERKVRPRLSVYATMTSYSEDFNFPVAFPPHVPENTFGEVVSDAGMRQLRIAETEKYAHVTFFFNGGREPAFPGEDRVLVPSPKVATYDLQPSMSAPEVTKRLLGKLDSDLYDFILLNFANPDMVGHTGDFEAAKEAARTVDSLMGRIVDKVLSKKGSVVLTADHGNLEEMRESDGVSPHTAHTTNPVPFIWISPEGVNLKQAGGMGLASIAPTLLHFLGLKIPAEMDAPLLF